MKNITVYTSIKRAICILLFFTLASFIFAGTESTGLGTYSVNVTSSLIMRSAPDQNSAKLGNLQNGELIHVESIQNGWAKITYHSQTGYVKADYIVKHITQEYKIEDNFISTNHFLYKTMPYAGLGLFVLLLIFLWANTEKPVLIVLCLLGIVEILFSIGCEEKSGVNPWFCEPNSTGWLWTIINYFIMVGILAMQYYFYKGYVKRFDFGCFGNLLFGILMVSVGISLQVTFKSSEFWFVAPLAVGVLFLVLLLRVNSLNRALFHTFFMTVAFGGLVMAFLQMLGVLLMGGLLILLAMAFLNSSSSSSDKIIVIDAPDGKHHVDLSKSPSDDYGWDEFGYKWTRTNEGWRRD